MLTVPIIPSRRNYRGSKAVIRQKMEEFNAMALRVAEHVNTQIANNPDEIQQYLFARIANDLGLNVGDVRAAVPGDHHGFTVRIGPGERRKLAHRMKPA